MIDPSGVWTYRARPVRAVDGDTVELVVDHGCGIHSTQHVRILGVDTPELRSWEIAEKRAGEAARDFTQAWLDAAAVSGQPWPLLIRTVKDRRSFTRYLADVHNLAGDSLAYALREAGHAL